jgi:hypothetical protein
MTDPAFPDVTADLDGWGLVEESVETLFRLPAAKVRGATRRYEDERTRRAVRETTGGTLDREWRFLAATRVGFVPSLPPGTPTALLAPTVRNEARDAFADRLSERGLTGVEQAGEERVRIRGGGRARLTRYRAHDRVDGDDLPIAGWLAAWHDTGDFFVVTGGYPDCALSDRLGIGGAAGPLTRTGTEYRNEFVELLRSVG